MNHTATSPNTNKVRITAGERAGIPPRRIDFEFAEETTRYWYGNNAFLTTFWATLSALFPEGETFFVDSVKNYRHMIKDPTLKDQVSGFIGQEAMHSKEHETFNAMAEKHGFPTDKLDKELGVLFKLIRKYIPKKMQLAIPVALEHYTAILAEQLLREDIHQKMFTDEEAKKLWMWHAFEEVEHEAALHDAWTYVHGKSKDARNLRVVGAIYIIAMLVIVWPIGILAMHPKESNHKRLSLKFWKPLIQQLFGSKGLMRGSGKNLLNLIRKDFHPFDMYDPIPILNRWRSKLTKPEWEKSFKLKDYGKNEGDVKISSIGLSDINKFVRFQGAILLRTKKFISEVRSSRNNIAKA